MYGNNPIILKSILHAHHQACIANNNTIYGQIYNHIDLVDTQVQTFSVCNIEKLGMDLGTRLVSNGQIEKDIKWKKIP